MGTVRETFGRLGWRRQIGVIVFIALAIAVALAILVLSLGVAIVLIPIVAVATLIARWRFSKAMRDAAFRRTDRDANQRAIEVEYKVIGRD
jgi:membrane protein implicated in regulation of membrane protease activity